MTQGVIEGLRLPAALRRRAPERESSGRVRSLAHVLLAIEATLVCALAAWTTMHAGTHGTDFWTFYESGRRALHGLSPYPSLASLPTVADPKSFAPFVYPPPAALAMIPLAVLPFKVAAALFFALSLGATALALRVLGVREWPCYAAAFASLPVVAAPANGTISAFLLLGAALAWRYRDHTWRVACAVAAVTTAKLFLWPLWLWLVYTRRYAAAALSAVVGVGVTLAAWAAIGFAGLADYPRLLSRLSELTGTNSYSLYALERVLGVPHGVAQPVLFLGGLLAACAAVRYARGERRDERAFVAAIGLALLMTPILWPHYLVLLFVPIAITRPTMSGRWFVPMLFWLDGSAWAHGDVRRILPVLALSAMLVTTTLRSAE